MKKNKAVIKLKKAPDKKPPDSGMFHREIRNGAIRTTETSSSRVCERNLMSRI